jgi:PAS domain S-box-containing protein
VALVINFLRSPNFNFVEMSDPGRIPFLGEEVSVANGIVSSWTRLGELSSLLLIVFLIDATIQLLRRGEKRRAGIAAAMLAFILGAAGVTSLTHAGVVTWPYVLSFGFLGVMVVMTYDLATDVARVAQLSRDLATSETALKEREGLLAVASVAPELAFWSWDAARDEVWMTANGRALRGLSAEEPLDFEKAMSCLHPEDREGHERAILESLETGGGFQRECRLLRPDGQVRWISSLGRAVAPGANGSRAVRGVSIDVTAHKLAEIETRQQRAEIAHLSRMTSVGELSGSIAHEINQPLAAILSNAQAAQRFLASNGGHPEEVREILEDIVREDKHAGEVIRRLRQFVRKGEESFEVLDPQGVIVDALRLLRTDLLDRGVLLDTDISPRLPPVKADRVQIQQVLINLVTNACDAMADVEPSRRRLVLRAEPSAEGMRVTVSDRGNGLPEGETDRIFEPFVTTKSHGMGLGLAVCRTIVGAHGGRLRASNNPEGGATFEFTIPSVEASA